MAPLKRALGWPFRRLLDPRVDQVVAAMDERLGSESEARPSVHDRLDKIEMLETHLGGHLGLIEERIAGLDGRLAAVTESAEAVVEGTRLVNESLAGFEPEYQIPPLDRRLLAELRWPAAEFLNWAGGPDGYAAQAGIRTAHPVRVALEAGGASVLAVTAGLVEEPFVFAALATLEPGARVMVAGGTESTVALSLAALGHAVTTVDSGGHPFAHPGLRALACHLNEVGDDEAGCDAFVALSIDDPAGLVRAAELCRPGGVLALTLPVSAPVDDVGQLLGAWELEDLRIVWRRDPVTWIAGSPDRPEGDLGIALVRARAPRG